MNEESDIIELSVKCYSGKVIHFDSSVSVPVDAPQEDRDAVVMAWMDLMRQALKLTTKRIKP